MYEVAFPTCYRLKPKRQPSAAEEATMLYGQHRAFQKTIMSTFLVFRLGYKFISLIYLYIYSNHEDTMKDINEIECVTCEVGVEVAEEVAGEYS
jgi:hypothetical protein